MKHILLIEPDPLLATQYKTYLQNRGHNVAVCKNAQSAIVAADAKRPDLIILELVLAGHSGIEFLFEFRSYYEWRKIPAIILSRLSKVDAAHSVSSLKELGVSMVLYKPHTSLHRLGEKVEIALSLLATTS